MQQPGASTAGQLRGAALLSPCVPTPVLGALRAPHAAQAQWQIRDPVGWNLGTLDLPGGEWSLKGATCVAKSGAAMPLTHVLELTRWTGVLSLVLGLAQVSPALAWRALLAGWGWGSFSEGGRECGEPGFAQVSASGTQGRTTLMTAGQQASVGRREAVGGGSRRVTGQACRCWAGGRHLHIMTHHDGSPGAAADACTSSCPRCVRAFGIRTCLDASAVPEPSYRAHRMSRGASQTHAPVQRHVPQR